MQSYTGVEILLEKHLMEHGKAMTNGSMAQEKWYRFMIRGEAKFQAILTCVIMGPNVCPNQPHWKRSHRF